LIEQITDENSYPGNLPADLEREKLVQLTRSIEENIGVRPASTKQADTGSGTRPRAFSLTSATKSM
jgi:hypothetical protein